MTLSVISGHLLTAGAALGATATFTPVGPTDVQPGTDVVFEVAVSVVTLAEFNTADIILGSNEATDLAFVYSSQWTAAFSNVTSPQFDVGIYSQDVFIGGNNPDPVGAGLVLGTVTIDTTGMSEGTYEVAVSSTFDGFSNLGLDGQAEALNGTASITISAVVVPTVSAWGMIAIVLLLLTAGTLVLMRANSRSLAYGRSVSP